MMKIYCACGRIVDLDIREMKIKLSLNKDIECTACRNARISRDIDCLNGFFNEGEITEGDSVSDIPA
jgi:hypothetical protein